MAAKPSVTASWVAVVASGCALTLVAWQFDLVFGSSELTAALSACVVESGAMPDAEERKEREAARAALAERTRDITIIVGIPSGPDRPIPRRSEPKPSRCGNPALEPAVPGISFGIQPSCLKEPEATPEQRAHAEEWVRRYEERRDRPLINAIHRADADEVRRLLASGEDVRKTERDGSGTDVGLLALAVRRWYGMTEPDMRQVSRIAEEAPRFAEIVALLLEAGADPSIPEQDSTALRRIASGPYYAEDPPQAVPIATALVAHGSPLSRPYPHQGALEMAAKRGKNELVEVMLAGGNASQADKDRALIEALKAGQWSSAIRLLAAGASPDTVPSTYGPCCDSPLIDEVLVRSDQSRDLIHAMVAAKVNPNVVLRTGSTVLMQVTHDHDLMEAFLEQGADPNAAREKDGNTALHLAARVITSRPPGYGDLSGFPPDRISNPRLREKSVALLLKHGADPNLRNKEGMTPLMLTSSDDSNAIRLLLDGGGRVEPDVGQGGRRFEGSGFPVGPVTWALLHGNETLATELVKRGQAGGSSDCGAFYYAARGGAVSTLEELLASKVAQYGVTERNGETPLIGAATAGHTDVVRLLLDRGLADINETTKVPRRDLTDAIGGVTPLMAAARAGRTEIVQILVERGAKIDVADRLGRTALDYAAESERESGKDIIQLLTARGATPAHAAPVQVPRTTTARPFENAAAAEIRKILDPALQLSPVPAAGVLLPGDDSAIERVRCELEAAFTITGDAKDLGAISVSVCTKNADRVGHLASVGSLAVQSLREAAGESWKESEAANAGLYYAQRTLPDGSVFFFYPTVLVGHGMFVLHNGVIHRKAAGTAVVVQATVQSLCQRDNFASNPLCSSVENSLKQVVTRLRVGPDT